MVHRHALLCVTHQCIIPFISLLYSPLEIKQKLASKIVDLSFTVYFVVNLAVNLILKLFNTNTFQLKNRLTNLMRELEVNGFFAVDTELVNQVRVYILKKTMPFMFITSMHISCVIPCIGEDHRVCR